MRPSEKEDAERALMEEAAEWRMREAEGALSDDERAALEVWLDASEAHRAAYSRIEVAWNAVSDAASEPELVALRGQAFEVARRAGGSRWARTNLSVRARIFSLAAMLFIVVFASATWLHWMPRSYETGVGERRVIALEDGSHISLDAATEVRVRFTGSQRELWLEHGRAKFDVARDPLRPFSVTAESRTVVATGTSFSVELVNDEVRVVLYEGTVSVLERAGDVSRPIPIPTHGLDHTAALIPGHELIAPTSASAVVRTAAVDPVRSLSWEAGQLSFDDEPLPTAIARMNRYATTPLSIGDPYVARLRVSGVFRAGDTDAFIEGVGAVLPIRTSRTAEGTELVTDPERIRH